jgi:hypothetical protein
MTGPCTDGISRRIRTPRAREFRATGAILGVAACLALAGACRSSLSIPSESELRRTTRSVVNEPTFSLFSPYDEASTARYADSVRGEIEIVRRLIPSGGAKPVRIYFAPIEDDSGRALPPWQTPSHRSLKGAAMEGEYAFVYVPVRIETSSALLRAVFMRGGTLRHELAHLYAARVGLARAPWFDEGLAEEVEAACESEGEVELHPFPPNLLHARAWATPGSLALLFAWQTSEELPPEDLSRRYVWAQALFRFLCEQRTEERFEARARAVMELGEKEILAREPEWLAWLAHLDALECIRAGAKSSSASERARCIGVMPELAQNGARELFTREADELALDMLVDPACMPSAARFLLYFRARALRTEDVEHLSLSADPAVILTAQALRARRKEPVDLECARAAWRRLPESDRARCAVFEALLPGSRD